ncbi:hypothetical protein, partial [Streptomyces sp. NPDC006355]|uniref:hypothetical protein n=1 Tax=Streptomyces sp. NPDC006355 TaxID=3156758 RepID=UPI0033A75687
MASGAEVVGVTAGVLTAGGGALSVASPDGVRLAVADGLADVDAVADGAPLAGRPAGRAPGGVARAGA